MDILDQNKIFKLVCKESRRHLIRVNDSDGEHNIIGNHCFCFFFAKECLSERAFMCKHILAAKLAEALNKEIKVGEIDDVDFSPLLLGSRAHLKRFDEKKTIC